MATKEKTNISNDQNCRFTDLFFHFFENKSELTWHRTYKNSISANIFKKKHPFHQEPPPGLSISSAGIALSGGYPKPSSFSISSLSRLRTCRVSKFQTVRIFVKNRTNCQQTSSFCKIDEIAQTYKYHRNFITSPKKIPWTTLAPAFLAAYAVLLVYVPGFQKAKKQSQILVSCLVIQTNLHPLMKLLIPVEHSFSMHQLWPSKNCELYTKSHRSQSLIVSH